MGDESQPPELEVFYWGDDDADHPVSDGVVVDLIEPPQGGKVIFVGARARNIDSCNLLLTGAIRDSLSNQVRLDTRTVNLEPLADGWGTVQNSNLSVYANIPACHNSWSDQSLYEGDYSLEVSLVDRAGRKAQASFPITTRCTEKSQARPSGPEVLAECLCICREGYILGEPCDESGTGGAGGSGGAP